MRLHDEIQNGHGVLHVFMLLVLLPGWLVIRFVLCPLGRHIWLYDERRFVPYCGHGHDVCFVCEVVEVKP